MNARNTFGWAGDVAQFLSTSQEDVLDALNEHAAQLFANVSANRLGIWQEAQGIAWKDELRVLSAALTAVTTQLSTAKSWGIALEYELPQQGGRRPDVILLVGSSVVILEFKMKSEPTLGDIDQLAGYLRDIEDYHTTARHASSTCGALVVTKGKKSRDQGGQKLLVPADLATYLLSCVTDGQIQIDALLDGRYEPAPGLLDAAIANWEFAPPQLKTVSSSNIPQAEACVRRVITEARSDPEGTRRLIFVSGTPGAGKTFVGLNLVHDLKVEGRMRFLSGNGPLVQVLNFALNQNQELVTAMHKYRDYFERRTPAENVIVFDEAQRALDAEKMRIKFNRPNSEAHIMLDILTRTPKWGVMVLLVGNGQEIYNGEVGLSLWFDEIKKHFPSTIWHVHMSLEKLVSSGHLRPEDSIHGLPSNVIVHDEPELHLNTSIRTHRAGHVHEWVNSLLDGDIESSRNFADSAHSDGFVIYITRDLDVARSYLRDRFSGSPRARYGVLMASRNDRQFASSDIRAIDRTSVSHWYVDSKTSENSCTKMSTAATEFQCQGLELDFTIVCWADDITWQDETSNWKVRPVQTPPPILENPAQTRVNVYRVLLTRGRDGMVLYLPPDTSLDSTFRALCKAGARPINIT